MASDMDVSADSNPVDDLSKQLEGLKIGSKSSGFLGNRKCRNFWRRSSTAAECYGFMDTPRPIPQDEVIYIIAAHGMWNNTTTFRGLNYPEGHDIIIEAPNEHWGKLNFGVLVSEGTILLSKNDETRQQAVMRHIRDILKVELKYSKISLERKWT